MEIVYFNKEGEAFLMQAPLRGGMRGKAKKTVWVDIGSLVIVAETDLGGKTHEIIAVLTPTQVVTYRKVNKDADPRLFVKDASVEEDAKEGIIFEEEEDEEVNVDAI
jgi:hypothetical protein